MGQFLGRTRRILVPSIALATALTTRPDGFVSEWMTTAAMVQETLSWTLFLLGL